MSSYYDHPAFGYGVCSGGLATQNAMPDPGMPPEGFVHLIDQHPRTAYPTGSMDVFRRGCSFRGTAQDVGPFADGYGGYFNYIGRYRNQSVMNGPGVPCPEGPYDCGIPAQHRYNGYYDEQMAVHPSANGAIQMTSMTCPAMDVLARPEEELDYGDRSFTSGLGHCHDASSVMAGSYPSSSDVRHLPTGYALQGKPEVGSDACPPRIYDPGSVSAGSPYSPESDSRSSEPETEQDATSRDCMKDKAEANGGNHQIYPWMRRIHSGGQGQ